MIATRTTLFIKLPTVGATGNNAENAGIGSRIPALLFQQLPQRLARIEADCRGKIHHSGGVAHSRDYDRQKTEFAHGIKNLTGDRSERGRNQVRAAVNRGMKVML
jgi:hypothetical protein